MQRTEGLSPLRGVFYFHGVCAVYENDEIIRLASPTRHLTDGFRQRLSIDFGDGTLKLYAVILNTVGVSNEHTQSIL